MFRLSLFLLIQLFLACGSEVIQPQDLSCSTAESPLELSYNELVQHIPAEVQELITELPDSEGALGRNKVGYFHVRFQLGMSRLSDYAISQESPAALNAYVQTLEYAFSYQRAAGDFDLLVPEDLSNTADFQPPSAGDLASGVAFFGKSLGVSLLSLEYSPWFNQSPEIAPLRDRIRGLRPQLQAMLVYLKTMVDELRQVDAHAPNRLLFDAIAFYTLGQYLVDEAAQEIGLDFARKAFQQVDAERGYFIEGGDYDSSYNGVALQLAVELWSLLPLEEEASFRKQWWPLINCAAAWQQSRVLANGEISTTDNTRVFPGGEEFLGREKDVDVLSTLKSFYYVAALIEDEDYADIAGQIRRFYQ